MASPSPLEKIKSSINQMRRALHWLELSRDSFTKVLGNTRAVGARFDFLIKALKDFIESLEKPLKDL